MVTLSRFEPVMEAGSRYKTFCSRRQQQLVGEAVRKLRESGFYWGALSGSEASGLLRPHPAGTFLLRDSSDRRHFFTLSVQTACGAKNLRVQCDSAAFFLQTDPRSAQPAPRFDCVLKLVHHYMPAGAGGGAGWGADANAPFSSSSSPSASASSPREAYGGDADAPSSSTSASSPREAYGGDADAPSSSTSSTSSPSASSPRGAYFIYSGGEKVPLELLRPLCSSAASLQHLCRKTVNGHQDACGRTDQLPHPLKDFLQEYDAPI
ncbi:suppressor of cytokine signaling 3-like [Anguilla rostrata]|uniref:suppressor of cytokine signaling 3-like n=1 Tax=Anguilla rostrata TaxID=7938 RepID=UPI0030CD09EA